MASIQLKFHLQSLNHANLSTPFPQHTGLFLALSCPKSYHNHHNNLHVPFFPTYLSKVSKVSSLFIHSSLSYSNPPTSKEEAILQAKTCLSTTLEKPLNNPKLAGKIKKLKQPRFQVEIPIIDDSPTSVSQVALDIFKDLSIRRKGSPVKILILWSSPTLKSIALEAFQSHSSKNVEHADVSSVVNGDNRTSSSADVAVFLAPERSQLQDIKSVCDSLYPKPIVIFNPKWGFEEEGEFGDLSGFVGSFEVIYSFVGLEVKGILSKRKAVIFKCVRDGVVSGERWTLLAEEEGGLKVVSRFKARPSIGEVETILYNLAAINSPITKSAKFLKDLVSNVTRKK